METRPSPDTSLEQAAITGGLERLITWARRMKPPRGMSASSFTTLDTLSFAGPCRISELAEREGLTQPGMTTLVNRLESDGLAIRAADPSDGRASLVSITDTGLARVAAYRAARAELIGSRIARLDDADQAALLAAVSALERLTADLPTRSSTTAAKSGSGL